MRALLDTNAVIYLQKGLLAEELPEGEYFVSVITEMELLSFPGLDESQQGWLKRLLADVDIIPLDDEIKLLAIELRRLHRLKLPDAIVAASAIASNAVLLTNDKGLYGIPDLQVRHLLLRDDTM